MSCKPLQLKKHWTEPHGQFAKSALRNLGELLRPPSSHRPIKWRRRGNLVLAPGARWGWLNDSTSLATSLICGPTQPTSVRRLTPTREALSRAHSERTTGRVGTRATTRRSQAPKRLMRLFGQAPSLVQE